MLDKEQYDLITKPGAGLVAIQGSAGSGKTTVGLHRVAYLHATPAARASAPTRCSSSCRTRRSSTTRAASFPALGVEGVPVMTFAPLVGARRVRHVPEAPVAISDETPPLVTRVKNHAGDARGDRDDRRRDDTRGSTRRSQRRCAALARGRSRRSPRGTLTKGAPDRRVTQLAQWIVGQARSRRRSRPRRRLFPQVTRSAVESLGQELRTESRNVLGAWDELLTSRERLDRHFGKHFGSGQLDQVHEWCVRQARVRAEGERDGETPTLDLEDRALLLRLFQVLRGPLLDGEGQPLTRRATSSSTRCRTRAPSSSRFSSTSLRARRSRPGDATSPALRHARGRRRAAHARRRRRARRVRLGRDAQGARRAGRRRHDRAAQGELPLDRGDHVVRARRARSVRARGRADRDARRPAGRALLVRVGGRSGRVPGRRAARSRARASPTPTSRSSRGSRSRPRSITTASSAPRSRTCAACAARTSPGSAGFDVTDVRPDEGPRVRRGHPARDHRVELPRDAPQARHALYVGATRAAHQLWCISSDAPSKLVTDGLAAAEERPSRRRPEGHFSKRTSSVESQRPASKSQIRGAGA